MDSKREQGRSIQNESLSPGLADSPDSPPSASEERSLLSEADRHRVLVERNATREFQCSCCLHQQFEAQAARTPEAVALVCDGERLTYRQLNERSNQLAHHLRSLGVGTETVVGLWLEPSLNLIVGLLGILKAGGAYLPIDRAYPPERGMFMLRESQALVLVSERSFASKLATDSLTTVCLDDASRPSWQQLPTHDVDSGAGPDNLAYVIYTSGTTGQPKGSLLTHRNVSRLFAATDRWFGFNAQDVWTLFHSAAFDFSVWEIWGALLYGGRLVVVPFWVSRSPEDFYVLLEREQVTVLNQTPTAFGQFKAVEERRPVDKLALRYVIFGGEALEMEGLRTWFERHGDQKPQLVNMYGITETTVHVTYRPLTRRDLGARSVIGVPIPDLRLYILDEQQRPVPIGAPGEIYVGGAGVARGYLRRPELTAQRFVQDPFTPGREGRLYRSGDCARHLPGGDIEYLGRLDHQVKIRGFRIELGEIESVLTGAAGVTQAVVLVREPARGDQRLVAFVVPRLGSRPSVEELRVQLQARLPEYMVPAVFVLLEQLPLTPNGKVDRKALTALPVNETARPHEAVAPRTPHEKAICQVWREILGRSDLGVQDDFFMLGGHSLLAMRAAARLGQELQRELPVRWFFEHRTVEALARHLEGEYSVSLSAIVPVPRDRPLPLSHEQERLWFLHRLDPESCAYNVPLAFRTHGSLDLDKLGAALAVLEQRHEMLRTSFGEVDGQPVQQLHTLPRLRIEGEDLRSLPEAQRATRLTERLDAEGRRPFDLAVPPLLRVHSFQLGEQEHVLLFTAHHIICDEWSLRLLLRELEALVAAGLDETKAGLPALPVQYADYAVWQRQHDNDADREADRTFWRGALAEAPARLELLADRARPSRLSGRGGTLSFSLPAAQVRAIDQLGQQQGASGFVTWLALFRALLERCSGQSDIVIGTPLAYRQRAELQGIFGFFLNMLPLRGDKAVDLPFAQAVQREHTRALEAFAHGQLPLGDMVRLHPGEHVSLDTPLFSTSFVFLDEGQAPANWLGCRTQTIPLGTGTAKFELTLSLERRPDGALEGVWEYSTDLFNHDTIERLQAYLRTLMDQVAERPQLALAQLDILPAGERHRVLVEWNATQVDYPRDVCLHHLLEAQAAHTPDAVAVEFEGQSLTYQELHARANQLAHHLRSLGVGPDVLVGLCAERSLEMVVGLLGILKAGGAYVPLDPEYPRERLEFTVRDAAMPILLSQRRVAGRVPTDSLHVIWLDELRAEPGQPAPSELVAPTSLAYVIYTSGSTGTPKGVEISHQALINCLCHFRRSLHLRQSDVWLAMTTLSFDIAGLELWLPLMAGARVVLVTRETAIDSRLLIQALTAHRATVLQATPVTWQALIQAGWKGDPNLQILCGGEAMDQGLADKLAVLGSTSWNLYGPTETTIWSTARRVVANQPITIGKPISNTAVYILAGASEPAPIGVAGDLFVGGDSVGRGYRDRPELTAERFLHDPFRPHPAGRMYKTGDRARWLPDGTIEFLGRFDDQVKIRGFRIELGEIENVLRRHPDVSAGVVLARPDATGGKQLVGYVVRGSAEAISESDLPAELRRWLQARLPEYMVPAVFVLLEQLPLTPNGKVDRKALAELGIRDRGPIAGSMPLITATEKALAAIWCQLLSLKEVGATDDFFSLGGHSLLAVRLIDRVRKELGVLLPLRTVLERPEIRGIAFELDRLAGKSRFDQLSSGHPECSSPPLFLLGWLLNTEGFPKEQPIYVLPFPDFGHEALTCRVEHLADKCMETLRSVSPCGPYRLAGYSLAGLVAFEMARRLRQEGEDVPLVAIIDTVPSSQLKRLGVQAIESAGRWLRVPFQVQLFITRLLSYASGVFGEVGRVGIVEQLRSLWDTLTSATNRLKAGARVRPEDPGPRQVEQSTTGGSLPKPQDFGKFWRHVWAYTLYRPQPYDGDVTLILSQATADAVGNAGGGWQHWAKHVDTVVIPGDHGSCVRQHRAILAAELSRRYDAAVGSRAKSGTEPTKG